MARTTNSPARRRAHKRVLKQAKGYWGARHRLYRQAKQAVARAQAMAFTGRRLKKRQFRRLWITRISAACRQRGIMYSRFMNGLRTAGVELNRKELSELAVSSPEVFDELVAVAQQHVVSAD